MTAWIVVKAAKEEAEVSVDELVVWVFCFAAVSVYRAWSSEQCTALADQSSVSGDGFGSFPCHWLASMAGVSLPGCGACRPPSRTRAKLNCRD